jgi:hypothetical protein
VTQRKDRIRVHIEDKEFSVVGGSFQEMLAAVKQINGRRFVSELKVWQLPGTAEELRRQLEISGYNLEGGTPLEGSSASPEQISQVRSSSDRIRILIGGQPAAVVGGSFQEMLAVVKNLPGRRFDPQTKVWEIPGDLGVIKGMIQAAGFEFEGADNIPIEAVPPMEPPDFGRASEPPPPPFEPPAFFEDDNEFPFEPPDWWDDGPPPAFEPDLAPPPFEDAAPAFDKPSAGVGPASGSDQIRLRLGEMPLIVSGGSFQEMLAVIKKIPGRRFNPDEKLWNIPAEIELETVQQAVKAAGFVLSSE